MKQESVFHATSILYENLQGLFDEIIKEEKLPKNSLHLFSNKSHKGKKAGEEISKSICIYEPEYPPSKDDFDNPGKNFVVMNLRQKKSSIELLIRDSQFNSIERPTSADIKKLKSDVFIHVIFSETDNAIFPYIKENILYCLSHYRSKEKTFGCCSLFIKCSDSQKCIHANRLYATSCLYRHQLESGKIFYGKNKNI